MGNPILGSPIVRRNHISGVSAVAEDTLRDMLLCASKDGPERKEMDGTVVHIAVATG